MGYFNLNSIFYNLRKIFKYLSFSLLIVAFVVLALLLMGKDVHAAIGYPDNNGVPDISDNLLDKAIEFYESSNFDSYFVIRTDSNTYGLILFNNLNDNTFYVNTDGPASNNIYWLKCTKQDNITTEFYSLTENGTNVSINYELSSLKFGVGAYRYKIKGIYSSNNNVYYSINIDGAPNLNNPMFVNNYENFEKPYIALPNDTTDVYISGEFGGFMVVAGHDVVSDNILNVLDFFYTDYGEEFTEQNTVLLRLDKNSPYYLNNYENNNVFIIPKNVIPYLDGHEYYIQLRYVYNNIPYQSDAIQWTTSFSEQAILNDQIRMQDSIDNINGFLNNNKYNNGNIINNMPNSNQYTSPTDSGIDSIFTALYNAFTTNQTQTLRFVIPFTNEQYIDIPSDLVTSRLPQSIIFLIQSVYWYIICRYIIKDIASIAEKAKSGEILDGSSDGNIKTDLL